ncbi:MAG TPA: hypothetical protein VFE62_21275 [Gemmataceae bacterium]|nr:hypothetical protein [Gemmataceae bacterium]
MSQPASPLPSGWMTILDDVHMRLDQAIASANARMDEMSMHSAPNMVEARHQEVTRWRERLARLNTFLESAEQVVQSVDEVLQQEETRLRNQMAASARLRQKLAQDANGAIEYKT